MTYDEILPYLTTLNATSANQQKFMTLTPLGIEYVERRMYADLKTVAAIDTQTALLTIGNRALVLSALPFVVRAVQRINLITPAGTTNPDLGTRKLLMTASVAYLDFMYPTAATTGEPDYMAVDTADRIILGPAPNAAYTVEITGVITPTPLSPTNQTTFLTRQLGHMFCVCYMVFIAGSNKNYGAGADDPQQAMSWEQQYGLLKAGAEFEEAQRSWSNGVTSGQTK